MLWEQTRLSSHDYVYQDEPDDFDNFNTKKNENTISLNGQWDKGSCHVWGGLAYAEGFSGNELFAAQLMPFYDIKERFQVVGRYTYITSSDDNQVGLSREKESLISAKGDEAHEVFLGDTYLYLQAEMAKRLAVHQDERRRQ